MTARRQDATGWHRLLVGLSVALLLVVALAGPNAAKPDLRSGWPLDGLLPVGLSSHVVALLLWVAYAVGAAAVVLSLWRRVRPTGWSVPLGLGAVALVAAPMGSGDHLNYAAYGRILVLGGDPWTASPADFGGGTDPITSAVEEPWRTEPSVYGPAATLLHAAAAAAGGEHLRLVVLAWQVVVVAAWLAVRWGLRCLVDPPHHGRVDSLWTLNPLVLSVGLLGAHVDTVAAALVVLAIALFTRLSAAAAPVNAGVLVGLAAGMKFTYAVALAAIVLAGIGVPHTLSRISGWHRAALLLAGFLPTTAILHVWTGGHVYDQVGRSRGAVSLASPWRLFLEWASPQFGGADTRTAISITATVVMIAMAALLAWATRSAAAGPGRVGEEGSRHTDGKGDLALARRMAWSIVVLTAAYALIAPYTLPWYDLFAWALLAALAPSLLDGILLARLVLVASAYVPGRVLGMEPELEELTLLWRRGVVPWLQLALWIVAVALLSRAAARAASWRRTALRPPGQ